MNDIHPQEQRISRLFSWLGSFFIIASVAGCASMMGSANNQTLITEQKSIPQQKIKVSYMADGVYQVQNNLSDSSKLLWDSSAYLNTAGDTIRLIHMESDDDFPEDVKLAQIQTVIAPDETLKTYFVGESWIDYARRGVTPRPKDKASKAMIFLAFEIKGKRVYWKGEVTFMPAI